MADVKVVSKVITKVLYGFSRNSDSWILLTEINVEDMTKFDDVVDEIFNEIDQGGRNVSLGNLMFKPEDFIAFRIE